MDLEIRLNHIANIRHVARDLNKNLDSFRKFRFNQVKSIFTHSSIVDMGPENWWRHPKRTKPRLGE